MEDQVVEPVEQEVAEPVLVDETSQVATPVEADGAEGTPVPEHWLPEELRGNERLKGFDSPEALARAYAEAPLAQAVPESYTMPEGIPPQFGEWAKEQGLSQPQFDSILALRGKLDSEHTRVRDTVYGQGREQLFNEWGERKAENLKVAEGVFGVIPSGKKLANLIKATGEGANPIVIQALYELGSYLKEGGHIRSTNVGNQTVKDPLRARYPTMFKSEE